MNKGVVTPKEAKEKIDEQRAVLNGKTPENLEEQAISLIGRQRQPQKVLHQQLNI